MTPHEGPSERLPDPAPGCEPPPPPPRPRSRTRRRARGLSRQVRPRGLRCVHAGPMRRDRPRVTDPTAPGWPRGWAVRYIPFSLHAVVAVWSTWRIRLVAYGARLESVLGASPRGFESPILRHHPGIRMIPGFCRSTRRIPRRSTTMNSSRAASGTGGSCTSMARPPVEHQAAQRPPRVDGEARSGTGERSSSPGALSSPTGISPHRRGRAAPATVNPCAQNLVPHRIRRRIPARPQSVRPGTGQRIIGMLHPGRD